MPPLILFDEESDVTAVTGTNLTLSFFIEDASPSVTVDNIYWTIDDITIVPSSVYIFSSDLLSITIEDVELCDEGNYTITVSNPAGIVCATVTVDVECKLIFTLSFSHSLTCSSLTHFLLNHPHSLIEFSLYTL